MKRKFLVLVIVVALVHFVAWGFAFSTAAGVRCSEKTHQCSALYPHALPFIVVLSLPIILPVVASSPDTVSAFADDHQMLAVAFCALNSIAFALIMYSVILWVNNRLRK
jgi:hypothetical protein